MRIQIRETGKIEELALIDRRNGVNWVQDLIGNAGALYHGRGEKAGKFDWSEEEGAYLADQETFDWWDKYIVDYETTEREIEDLAEELEIDEQVIRERVQKNTGDDYGDHRREAIHAMREIEEEYDD